MATWNYVLNDAFIDAVGDAKAGAFVQALGEVAAQVRPGDRAGALELLEGATSRSGVEVPEMTLEKIAENMTLADHDRLCVATDGGRVLGEFPLPGADGVTSEELRQQEAPDDDDRPAYS